MVKDSKKIKIYSIAVYRLFEICFKNAGILTNGELERKNWSHALRNAIKKEDATVFKEHEWNVYNNYLRDRFNSAEKNVNNGVPKEIAGFYIDQFGPLLKFSGIPDIDQFNAGFDDFEDENGAKPKTDTGFFLTAEPIAIPVFYLSSKLKYADLLRTPDQGIIYVYPNGDLVYQGEEDLYIKKINLKEPSLQTMFRQKNEWIKAEFIKGGHVREAYFVESDAEYLSVASDPERLMKFLSPPQE